ncbi:hypothetical protein H8A99_36215, partial [Bradyrhizobium sp. Arg68]|nr:hypothetical protein [Bradyrhizobium ivorense]
MMRLPMRPWTILIAVVVVGTSFAISLKAIDWLAPRAAVQQPKLVEV